MANHCSGLRPRLFMKTTFRYGMIQVTNLLEIEKVVPLSLFYGFLGHLGGQFIRISVISMEPLQVMAGLDEILIPSPLGNSQLSRKTAILSVKGNGKGIVIQNLDRSQCCRKIGSCAQLCGRGRCDFLIQDYIVPGKVNISRGNRCTVRPLETLSHMQGER